MQASQSKTSHTWLVVLLAVVGISVFVASQHSAEMTGHILAIFSFVFPAAMVLFSVKMAMTSKSRYDVAIVWSLAAFSALWFAAEQIWDINEEVFHEYFSTSIADLFWSIGYGALLSFLLLILKPLRNHVTKKILLLSVLLALSFLVPSTIILVEINDVSSDFSFDVLYTILDSLVLVPTVCLFAIFKKLKENYMWTILFAIIITVATDTGYLFLELKGQYYLGHPIWVGYEWAFVLFAYGMYRQLNIIKKSEGPFIKQLKKILDSERPDDSSIMILTPIIVASAILIFAFSTIEIFEFDELTTQQIRFFQPIVFGVISAIITITTMILIINKKTFDLKTKIREKDELAKKMKELRDVDKMTREMSGQIFILENRLNRIEKTRTVSTRLLIGISVILLGVIVFYAYASYISPAEHYNGVRTKFVVENLNGDTVDTWTSWRLAPGEPLHISIINSDLVTPDKMSVIKNAILSEKTIQISNGDLGKEPPDLVETYYTGWKGALEKASSYKTSIPIPTDIEIDVSDRPIGEIVIILSNLRESDGTLAFTKSIADESANQILKSTITVFEVDNMDDHQLSAVVRHELGHAMGLGHSTAVEDLMYPTFMTHNAYMSRCDIDALVSLYDQRGTSSIVCEN